MERLQNLVNDLKAKSDSMPGRLDPDTAKEMHLLVSCIKADLLRYLSKHIVTENRR